MKHILEAHGTQIGVQSEVGKGAKFFVELPIIACTEDDAGVTLITFSFGARCKAVCQPVGYGETPKLRSTDMTRVALTPGDWEVTIGTRAGALFASPPESRGRFHNQPTARCRAVGSRPDSMRWLSR